jgi:hypothetical protein
MAFITGPELDRAKKELVDWYLRTRKSLIEAMEEGYPYGSYELSPQEQIQRFVGSPDEAIESMRRKLMERHRGQPNRDELVEDDIRRYIAHITQLMRGGRE